MEFVNSFEVSLPPQEAWPLLMDVQTVVPCMPGAEIVEIIDDRTFKGKVSVRLGPVGLVFLCDAHFDEIDNAAHRADITASGADAKGRGTARAQIRFALQPSAKGSKVDVSTSLTLSGAVAQYGRGVGLIQNVASQIIAQFARNLEVRITQLRDHEAMHGTLDAPVSDASKSDAPGYDISPSAHLRSEPPRATHSTAAPDSGSSPAGGYPRAFTEGFAAGFTAGHQAGFAAAHALLMQDRGAAGVTRTPPPPPFAPAKPISGLSLAWSSVSATVRGWFSGRAQ